MRVSDMCSYLLRFHFMSYNKLFYSCFVVPISFLLHLLLSILLFLVQMKQPVSCLHFQMHVCFISGLFICLAWLMDSTHFLPCENLRLETKEDIFDSKTTQVVFNCTFHLHTKRQLTFLAQSLKHDNIFSAFKLNTLLLTCTHIRCS